VSVGAIYLDSHNKSVKRMLSDGKLIRLGKRDNALLLYVLANLIDLVFISSYSVQSTR